MKNFLLLTLTALTALHAAPTDDLAKYNYGDSRLPLMEIQSTITKADSGQRADLERQFIALLDRPDVPTGAKDAICRWLQVIGTSASIPALEKVSADPKIGFLAVYALMSYPQPEATTALLRFVEKSSGPIRTEAIGALGRRGATEAVPVLAKINEPAAWTALGAIGSVEAVTALQKFPASQDPALDWARVYGALKVLPTDKALATGVFQTLLKSPAHIGAVEGLIRAQDPGALAAVQALLLEGDLDAAKLAKPFAATLVADFGKWTPAVRRAVVLACADLAMSRKGLESTDDSVHTAAIQSLGRSTDPAAIALLLPLLTNEKDAAAAAGSLQKITGAEADTQLRAALKSPAQAAVLIILAERQDREALPAAFAATQSDDEKIRSAGFEALALLARSDDLAKFLDLSGGIKAPADRALWVKTLLVMVANSTDPDGTAILLDSALTQASPEIRPTLLISLASLPSDKAKATLAKALQTGDLDQRKAVIRTLSGVRNATSAELLLAATRAAKDPSEHMLALRGYLDGLRTRTDLSPDQLFAAYQAGLALATEPSEKDAIYAGIKAIKNSPQAAEFLKKKPAGA